MDISHAFGKALQKLRKEKGYSQETLALSCGLDRTFISLLERGERQPSLTTIFTIADELGTYPSDMVASVEKMIRKAQR
jgi:transcriptional regulator with XRE-family HTH domain